VENGGSEADQGSILMRTVDLEQRSLRAGRLAGALRLREFDLKILLVTSEVTGEFSVEKQIRTSD
jgi:hypothetical protein